MKKAKIWMALSLGVVMMAGVFAGCGKEPVAPGNSAQSTESKVEDTKEENSDVDNDMDDAPEVGGIHSGAYSEKLYQEFLKAEEGNDLQAIANTLADDKVNGGFSCMVESIKEGFLPGFSADITGFTEGVAVKPMIGSQPFVIYLFETEDPDGLKATLEKYADPMWNICTIADETQVEVVGNRVFFVMCPSE